MKKRFFIFFFLTFFFQNVKAHQDFYIEKEFGNVKVRIKTGYDYREIRKIMMIGSLAKEFLKQKKYTKKVFLDFDHYYIEDCKPDYFISFDKGSITYIQNNQDDKEKSNLKKKGIVIRQVGRIFNSKKTIQLLEIGIDNVSYIKSKQKKIEYKKNYNHWKINTIDTLFIQEELEKPISKTLKKILEIKIKSLQEKNSIKYFLQKNQFHFPLRRKGKQDSILLSVDNIYDLHKVGFGDLVVFDTDSSFYFLSMSYGKGKASKRQIIENFKKPFRPYSIIKLGGDKYGIDINDWEQYKRVLIYRKDDDVLIQDLDELIDEHKKRK
jgi:hypothetical protein